MKKSIYFDIHDHEGWPESQELENYFLGPPSGRWFFDKGADSAALWLDGVDGTEHLSPREGRIDIALRMWANRDLGVLLVYTKRGGGHDRMFSSKSDLSRLREWVRSVHGNLLPIGLFIPFETAWKAVKEFIETDGKLPGSIEWVANRDLPEGTFPDP